MKDDLVLKKEDAKLLLKHVMDSVHIPLEAIQYFDGGKRATCFAGMGEFMKTGVFVLSRLQEQNAGVKSLVREIVKENMKIHESQKKEPTAELDLPVFSKANPLVG